MVCRRGQLLADCRPAAHQPPPPTTEGKARHLTRGPGSHIAELTLPSEGQVHGPHARKPRAHNPNTARARAGPKADSPQSMGRLNLLECLPFLSPLPSSLGPPSSPPTPSPFSSSPQHTAPAKTSSYSFEIPSRLGYRFPVHRPSSNPPLLPTRPGTEPLPVETH